MCEKSKFSHKNSLSQGVNPESTHKNFKFSHNEGGFLCKKIKFSHKEGSVLCEKFKFSYKNFEFARSRAGCVPAEKRLKIRRERVPVHSVE